MNKYIKAIGIALGVLVLIMFLAPVLFKGKIRELAVKQANENLDAFVELGDIRISLFRNFPKVYIGLHNLTITNKEPFYGDTLAYVKVLALTVDLPDLINGSPYTVEKINIIGPNVQLRVMHDGRTNWDVIPEAMEEGKAEESTSTQSFSLKIKSFKIHNGQMVYDDVLSQTYITLKGFDHSLSGDLSADKSKLKTSTYIQEAYLEYAHVPYLNRNEVALNATLDADLENDIYRFEDNFLKINDLMLNFQGSVAYVGDELNLLLTFKAPQNSFKSVLSLIPAIYAREFSTIKTEGSFSLEGFVKGNYSEDNLPAFRLGLNVKDGWFQYPDLPGTVKDVNLQAVVENPGGISDNTIVDISTFSFSVLEKPFFGTLRVAHPVSDPDIDLSVDGVIDLNDISRVYPLKEDETISGLVEADVKLKGRLSDVEKANYKAFEAMGSILIKDLDYQSGAFSVPLNISSAQLNVSPAYLDLVNLDARLGKSDFIAKGKIEEYLSYLLDNGKIRGNLMFDAGNIDLNELMAAGPEEELLEDPSKENDLPDTTELSAFLIPAEVDIILNATIDNLLYESIQMQNLKGKMEVKNSKLILNGLTMDAFGGKLLLNGSYETSDPANPLVDLVLGVTGADIGELVTHIPVMEKFAPLAAKTLGKVTGNISLASVLDAGMMPLYETVKGKGSFKTSDLEIKGVNTLNAISDALQMESFRQLDLEPLNLSFQIMDGLLNVRPFDFKAGNISMNLGGWTSLSQEIGYELKMKVPRSAFGGNANSVINGFLDEANQLGTDLKLGEVVELKALIEGTLTNPRLNIDLAGTGKGIVEEVKKEIKEEVIKKVDEEAEKILQEAQKRADAIMKKAREEADKIIASANQLADETRKQAKTNAAKLEKEAEDKGTFAVMAAKKAADEVRKEGNNQANNIVGEAKKQSDNILQKARQEADKILKDASDKVDSLK